MKKRCFFLTYDAYGDWYSVNGLVRYLAKKYSYIYPVVDYSQSLKKYATLSFVESMFSDVKNIKVVKNSYFKLIIKIPLFNFVIIDSRYNETNKIFTFLNVYNKNNPFKLIQNNNLNNSNLFYTSLGFDENIKFKYFDIPKKFLKGRKKTINTLICETYNQQINRKYILNKDNLINLHNMFTNPLDIIPLAKQSDEIHLIENSIALLIYYLNYKKLIKPRKVFLHLYARENEPYRYLKKEVKLKFFNMFLQPILPNWHIIYDQI